MFGPKLIPLCFVLALVNADKKDVGSESSPTTQETPQLKTRFFGLENILGEIFPPGVFGGHFHHSPQYHNQQNPHAQDYNNWQNIQTPNQAQSNFDHYLQSTTPFPQGVFNSQNIVGSDPNLYIQSPQQFPPQEDVTQKSITNQYPSQSGAQGNLNSGTNFGQNQFNPGTLDGIPSQNGINQGNLPVGTWNQRPGNQGFQGGGQMGNQNGGNQFGFQTPNGNQMGLQTPKGVDDYNPVAILGKPVAITTSVPDAIVFKDGCDTPAQRQCVQDCQSSTEYGPVCGSNNVTYFNSGRFICARNCGVNVFIQRHGRCENYV